MTVTILEDVARALDRLTPDDLPGVHPTDRRRARRLYDRAWGKTRRGSGWELPAGTQTLAVDTPLDPLRLWHLPGRPGAGTVVLAHPDRRYGGHWFVKEGWIDALQARGVGVVWFDQPGYGQGNGGSPFLYENVVTACRRADRLDAGPVRLAGISLGAFASQLATAHVPELKAVVLESPYPTFASWYEGKRWSMDKLAINAWHIMFRRSMPAVDGLAKFHRSHMPALVAWTKNDTTTAPRLSERVAAGRPNTETYVGDAEHLGLWHEPAYRERVLAMLTD